MNDRLDQKENQNRGGREPEEDQEATQSRPGVGSKSPVTPNDQPGQKQKKQKGRTPVQTIMPDVKTGVLIH
jgi:hypothetical protein